MRNKTYSENRLWQAENIASETKSEYTNFSGLIKKQKKTTYTSIWSNIS